MEGKSRLLFIKGLGLATCVSQSNKFLAECETNFILPQGESLQVSVHPFLHSFIR